MQLSIDYILDGAGWARCSVAFGEARCEVTASYLSDALGNLVLAATAVASGFCSVSFRFDEEPGEYRWVIQSVQPNVCLLEILDFPELWGNRPNTEGKVLFRAEMHPIVLGKAVHDAASTVLAKYGILGYAKEWNMHPFPSKALQLLADVIASSRDAV